MDPATILDPSTVTGSGTNESVERQRCLCSPIVFAVRSVTAQRYPAILAAGVAERHRCTLETRPRSGWPRCGTPRPTAIPVLLNLDARRSWWDPVAATSAERPRFNTGGAFTADGDRCGGGQETTSALRQHSQWDRPFEVRRHWLRYGASEHTAALPCGCRAATGPQRPGASSAPVMTSRPGASSPGENDNDEVIVARGGVK